jgi:hypothetical protein
VNRKGVYGYFISASRYVLVCLGVLQLQGQFVPTVIQTEYSLAAATWADFTSNQDYVIVSVIGPVSK